MIFLVECGVHDGLTASTIYLATDGYTSKPTDSPANQFYMDRLKNAGSIEEHLFSSGDGVSGGTTRGASQAAFGNISAVNGKPYGGTELIDNWIDLAFRTITIKSLDNTTQSLTQAVTRFTGSVDRLVSTRALDSFDLVIHDRLTDLDKPLLTNTYAGTTTSAGLGIEGTADLKDQIKPKIWGTKRNAVCVPVNPFDLLYQVSDGAVSSIVVYDAGVALTSAGNYASVAALVAAAVLPGQYATCLAFGVFRLGWTPDKTVTADVVEGTTAADRTAAQIVVRMVAWFVAMYPATAATVLPAAVTALDALNSAGCGVVVTGGETGLAAIMRVLNSIGGWMLPVATSASTFSIGRFDAPVLADSVASFDLDDNLGGSPERVETGDGGKGVPSYRVTVKCDQLGVVQKSAELAGSVTDERRAYLADEWRQAQDDDTSLLTQYQNAPEIVVESCLIDQAAALTEATRLLGLYSARRDIYRIKLPFADAEDCTIGSTVTLASVAGRMGLTPGKAFTAIGRIADFGPLPAVTLDFWG